VQVEGKCGVSGQGITAYKRTTRDQGPEVSASQPTPSHGDLACLTYDRVPPAATGGSHRAASAWAWCQCNSGTELTHIQTRLSRQARSHGLARLRDNQPSGECDPSARCRPPT